MSCINILALWLIKILLQSVTSGYDALSVLCFFSLGAVRFKASHFFLPLSVTVTKLQSLLSLRKCDLFFLSNNTFTVESLLFSPCCLRVLEDKVNTLSEFALPF